jgi:uncharacterized membrane protein YdbT with pleckstrin-like domain
VVTLTDRLIRIESGLFTRTHNEIRLERIESVGVRQSPLGRMLGFGELVIYGVGGNKDFLPALVRVDDFRRAVAAQLG